MSTFCFLNNILSPGPKMWRFKQVDRQQQQHKSIYSGSTIHITEYCHKTIPVDWCRCWNH